MSENKGLAAALVAAQAAAQAVYKASRNEFHKYRYASAEDMIEESRGALNGAGLAVMTLGWRVDWHPPGHERLPRGLVHVRYRLVHQSGESVDFECETSAIVEKGRPEDKAEATALTYNLGYFLRGLLCLPRSDEKGVDERDDRSYEPRRAPPKPATSGGTMAAEDAAIEAKMRAQATVEGLDETVALVQSRPEASKAHLRGVYRECLSAIKAKAGKAA